MLLRGMLLSVLSVLVVGPGPAVRAEDEPTFLDKKLSHWLSLLESGKDAKTRRQGLLAVEQIGHAGSRKVVPALVKALREDKEPAVRAAAARAIGRAVSRAYEHSRMEKEELPRLDYAREALATALRTEKIDAVREAAALGLGDLGPDAKGAVGSLAGALKDKHTPTVRAAASALRRVGREAGDAQAELQALLANKAGDAEARAEAAMALGQIKLEVREALPVLKDVLADAKADAPVRKAVAEALGKIGKDAAEATPNLAAALAGKDSPSDLRLAAVTALDQFGPDAKAAIPELIAAVRDPALIKLMGENARVIRCVAMQALGRMGKDLDSRRKEAVAALLKATEDPNVEVCVSAVETLGALSAEGLGGETDEVIKRLDTMLQREGRKTIREAAQAARDRIRPPKKG